MSVEGTDAENARGYRRAVWCCGQQQSLVLPELVERHGSSPRVGFGVTAAKVRSVWGTPPIGWVTVLAGLRACGFSRASGLPSFASGRNGCGSPLTVAGQPQFAPPKEDGRSVFPLASPGLRPGEPEPAQTEYFGGAGRKSIRTITQTGRRLFAQLRVWPAGHAAACGHCPSPRKDDRPDVGALANELQQ